MSDEASDTHQYMYMYDHADGVKAFSHKDFLFGKGAPKDDTPGKTYIKQLIQETASRYELARDRDEKGVIITETIEAFNEYGGHIIKVQPDGVTYRVVDCEKPGRKKIADMFYEQNKRGAEGRLERERIRSRGNDVSPCEERSATMLGAAPSVNVDNSFLEVSMDNLSLTPSLQNILRGTSLCGSSSHNGEQSRGRDNYKRHRSGSTVHSTAPHTKCQRQQTVTCTAIRSAETLNGGVPLSAFLDEESRCIENKSHSNDHSTISTLTKSVVTQMTAGSASKSDGRSQSSAADPKNFPWHQKLRSSHDGQQSEGEHSGGISTQHDENLGEMAQESPEPCGQQMKSSEQLHGRGGISTQDDENLNEMVEESPESVVPEKSASLLVRSAHPVSAYSSCVAEDATVESLVVPKAVQLPRMTAQVVHAILRDMKAGSRTASRVADGLACLIFTMKTSANESRVVPTSTFIKDVLKATRSHLGDVTVQERLWKILSTVAIDSHVHQTEMVDNGAIPTLICAMESHWESRSIQRNACIVLSNLVRRHRHNQSTVIASGGIRAVVKSIISHLKDSEVVVCGCYALVNLSWGNAGNQILTDGDVNAVQRVMRYHRECPNVQEAGCLALGCLAPACRSQPSAYILIVINEIISTMSHHLKDASVQRSGCDALASVSSQHGAARAAIATAGGIEAVLAGMSQHQEDAAQVQAYGCCALACLTENCERNQIAVATAGGITAVLLCMKLYPGNADVQGFGCRALSGIVGKDMTTLATLCDSCRVLSCVAGENTATLATISDSREFWVVERAYRCHEDDKRVQTYGKMLLNGICNVDATPMATRTQGSNSIKPDHASALTLVSSSCTEGG